MDLVVYNLLNTAARTLGLHRRQVCLLTLSTSMAPSTDHSPLHNNNYVEIWEQAHVLATTIFQMQIRGISKGPTYLDVCPKKFRNWMLFQMEKELQP